MAEAGKSGSNTSPSGTAPLDSRAVGRDSRPTDRCRYAGGRRAHCPSDTPEGVLLLPPPAIRATVLSANGLPIGEVSTEEAITMVYLDKAYVVESDPNRVYRSQHKRIEAPVVIGLFQHIELPGHYHGPARLTNQYLFLRDDYTCQYCGTRYTDLTGDNHLTRDHIFPTSRGGEDSWANVVAACWSCNNQKGDRTPQEAGLPVPEVASPPRHWEIYGLRQQRRVERVAAATG